MTKQLPDSGFDRAAWFYDALAQLVFGSAIGRSQSYFLNEIPAGARVLLIGGGSGKLLQALLRHTACSHILYLEASPKMLAQARQRVEPELRQQATQVEFRLGTEAALHPSEQFNVIITPFLLDLFRPSRVAGMVQQLRKSLQPEGCWLHTDFSYTSTHTVFWQKLLMRLMYRFFRLLCRIEASSLPDFDEIFRKAGLEKQQQKTFFRGMIEAAVFEAKQEHFIPDFPENA